MARRKLVSKPLVTGGREVAGIYLHRGQVEWWAAADASPGDRERVAAYFAEHLGCDHEAAYAMVWGGVVKRRG